MNLRICINFLIEFFPGYKKKYHELETDFCYNT